MVAYFAGVVQAPITAFVIVTEMTGDHALVVPLMLTALIGYAARLGLKANFVQATFDNILPSVVAGRYNLGVSSFTDNKEREKQVDFVTYYSAGYQWASRVGSSIDPQHACGLTVATGVGTNEDLVDIPALSKKCVQAGKKPISKLTYQTQDLTTQAVILGKAAAMDADSPVTGYAVASHTAS